MDDLDDLIDLVRDHCAEGPYKDIPFSIEKTEETLIAAITLDTGLVLCVMDDIKIIGVLVAHAVELPFSRTRIALEIMMNVVPAYRKTRAFAMIREAYEFWARKLSCVGNALSDMVNENSPRLEKVYPRLGYNLIERGYFKWLPSQP